MHQKHDKRGDVDESPFHVANNADITQDTHLLLREQVAGGEIGQYEGLLVGLGWLICGRCVCVCVCARMCVASQCNSVS